MKKSKTTISSVSNMRIWISSILRLGVALSALLIVTGGVLFLIQHPREFISFKNFIGQPVRLRHFETIFKEACQLRSRSVIQLGILVLIATPVIRVIFSLIEFLINRDWVFVAITAFVLLILFYSIMGL